MAKINDQPPEIIDTVVTNNVKGGTYLFAFYPPNSNEPSLWYRDMKIQKMRQVYDAIGRELKRANKANPHIY